MAGVLLIFLSPLSLIANKALFLEELKLLLLLPLLLYPFLCH
jgi:hypothetical protein